MSSLLPGPSSSRSRPYNFFYKVDGLEAEEMLMSRGQEGEFICRPSKSSPSDYTLSVRRKDKVTHIKIQKTGDFLDLFGGEKFATLVELVQYYMENPEMLREKDADTSIHLKAPLPPLEGGGDEAGGPSAGGDTTFLSERWFHCSLSGPDAEKVLLAQAKKGAFLVRESQSKPGQYALSVRKEDGVTHVIINRSKEGAFDVGGGDHFGSISALIDHYTKNPMVDIHGGVVHLRTPFNNTRFAASGIEERLRQLALETTAAKTGFWDEFEWLQQLESRYLFSRQEGQKPHNKVKNRYKNILPFDHTRVVLADASPQFDYINGNYIKVLSGYEELAGLEKRYISTQGCLQHTVVDFWRLVWQENSRLIVMTTRERERERVKCVRYWPEKEGESQTTGQENELIITLISEEKFKDYVVRRLTLTNARAGSEAPRDVVQWHFVAWPDHGCPSNNPGIVLNFLQEVNNCAEESGEIPVDAGPPVVHCSAGIGRTGTFIAIDLILHQIKRLGLGTAVDIQRTVQMLREQRSGMVQTETQYRFIYQAIEHFVQAARQMQAEASRIPPGREYTNIRYNTERDPRDPRETSVSSVTPTSPHAPTELPPPPPRRVPTPELGVCHMADAPHSSTADVPSSTAQLKLQPPPLPKRKAKGDTSPKAEK